MTMHTSDLDHGLAAALRETHSTFIEIDAVKKVDGEPVEYEVLFTHRYKVATSSSVAALAAALADLREAVAAPVKAGAA